MAAESLSQTLPRRAGAYTFAAIFAIESLSRALNSTVISLQAYDILGSSQKVSVLSTSVAFPVLAVTLLLPVLLGRMRRRVAYSLGAGLMLLASLSLASHSVVGQWSGMFLRNCGAAIFNVTLQLYILDHIRRQDLTWAEPLRLSLSTFSWMTGPALGVWLYVSYGPWGPQAAVAVTLAVLMAVFWYIRLSDRRRPLLQDVRRPFSPFANVRRFLAQPRLRLAWLVAFGRSCFWSSFFIYGPLLIVESGLGKGVSGLVISASQALLLSAYLSGRIARRHGVRKVVAGSFALAALASVGAGLAGTHAPYVAIALLLAGSLAASALDGVGGIPYLRAVRAHERQQMSAVYRTFIDFSELIPSLVFAFALMWLPIGAVFVILGMGLAVTGAIAWRYLPRSL
ncbi:MAG: MFS transporter [Rhizobiales bacterium]|nr:MFS transporter [Hyphomicrobiales bacterium]